MMLNKAIMQLLEMRESSMMPTVFKVYINDIIKTVSQCEEPSAHPEPCDDMSDYSDKLWKNAYERGRAEAILKIGKWKHVRGNFMTPAGTPYYECGSCGGSGHLHGVEFPKRKVICDNCGRINIYPYESASEETSSLWEND